MHRHLILALIVGVAFPVGAQAQDAGPPIPQNAEAQARRRAGKLEWNRKTLVEAYDSVGKTDKRWDASARKALEAQARINARAVDPAAKPQEVFEESGRALAAGCDDPLIQDTFARSSRYPFDPGFAEYANRWSRAASAMVGSAYPPLRRALCLWTAGQVLGRKEGTNVEARKPEAVKYLEAATRLIAENAAEPKQDPDADDEWYEVTKEVVNGFRQLDGEFDAAFERVDAVLAKVPALKRLRLQVKGDYLVRSAWEARGLGMANTVGAKAFRTFDQRLAEARVALDEAWALDPTGTRTPGLMLIVCKGQGWERDEMERWFARALEADGDNAHACDMKMDWLDPKWYGSREDVLAFGRACRETKNWWGGITLLAANAHLRVSFQMEDQEKLRYLGSPEVWGEIREIFEEYLAHRPSDTSARTTYAGLAGMCGHFDESNRQFRLLAGEMVPTRFFHMPYLLQIRAYAATQAKAPAGKQP